MKTYLTLLAIAVAAGGIAGCDKSKDTSGSTETTGASTPDNTRVNERDHERQAVTPIDQGNNRADLDTTRMIRKSMMADDSLSTDAKNVKIITAAGVITLRGPVKTEAEKNSIEAKARSFAGNNRVDNQLDVESGK